MAKFAERMQARSMREAGESIKVIARKLGVSKSTVSLWCLDIELTDEQIQVLADRGVSGGYAGRLLGSQKQRQRRIDRINYWNECGKKEVNTVNERELLMAGLGLYIGEGTKSDRKFQFSNSNPQIINMMVSCLERNFQVKREDLYCNVIIDEDHRHRVSDVEKRWSELIDIPLTQFRRTTFVKAKNKKVYANHNEHLGTLALRVKRCTELQRRILGLTAALMYNACVKMPV